MSSLPEPRRFSVREYLRMAETGILRPDEKVELLLGQIVAMSPQGPMHSALVARIASRLTRFYPPGRFCIRVQSPLAVSQDSAPEPDIAVVGGRCEDHERELPRTALVVVEVSDTSARLDRGRKSQLYAAAGVPEYWIVDIQADVVEIRREPTPTGYTAIRSLHGGDALCPSSGDPSPALTAADLLPVR